MEISPAFESWSDEELIAYYREHRDDSDKGDRAYGALRDRYEDHVAWLVKLYANKMCPNSHAPADFGDDIRGCYEKKLLGQLQSDKVIRSFRGLASSIVQTCAIDAYNFIKRGRPPEGHASSVNPGSAGTADSVPGTSAGDDPSAALEQQEIEREREEMNKAVHEALTGLGSSSDRGLEMASVLWLHYIERWTHEAIASHLRVSTKTVQRLMRKGEERLGELFPDDPRTP